MDCFMPRKYEIRRTNKNQKDHTLQRVNGEDKRTKENFKINLICLEITDFY